MLWKQKLLLKKMTLLDLMIIMVEKQNLIKMDRLYSLMVGELYGNNAVLYIEYTVVDRKSVV